MSLISAKSVSMRTYVDDARDAKDSKRASALDERSRVHGMTTRVPLARRSCRR